MSYSGQDFTPGMSQAEAGLLVMAGIAAVPLVAGLIGYGLGRLRGRRA